MLDKVLDNTYRLIEEIGKGAFGAVYRAVRIGSEGMGPVAIKVLNKHPSMKPKDYARFQREASLMSQLVHPGIVTVYELAETVDVCYYIVMELVAGSNLREHVRNRGGSLSLPEILDVLIQAADALEYVHGHHIEHRDIKPQNILVCEKGPRHEGRFQIKLVDFGVARLSPQALGGEDSKRSEIVGTYAYMSPEATGLLQTSIDHRSDIYSLGVVAYELLAGCLPFARSSADEIAAAHVNDPVPTLSQGLGRDVSPVLEGIVGRCLEKDPAKRYQSIFGLGCDLKRVRQDLRDLGRIQTFDLAQKDLDLMQRFRSIYIGREEISARLLNTLGIERKKARLSWILLSGGVGSGKSRCMDELRLNLEKWNTRYLYLKFSESERALPYQALSLAVNDYLTQFEKYQSSEYRGFVDELLQKTGDVALELARLIPALRPFLADSDRFDFSEKPDTPPADQTYHTPSNRLNQAFKELFDSLVGGENRRLVFLLDDIHVIDSATIALLQFLIEQMNSSVNFSFVLTMRSNLPHHNQMLEGLLRKLSGLKRRFHNLEIANFNAALVSEYFSRLGISNVTTDFVTFAQKKTDSSPLQLQLFVKQLISQDALISVEGGNRWRQFRIDYPRLSGISVELFNIETLISSLSTMEGRDRRILIISAICQEPCEFEFFKLDSDFSGAELETRIAALVRRGMLVETGDENLPMVRRSFSLSHEKLRGSLLSQVSRKERQKIHFLLVKRIKYLFRNPQRAQILLLAKHIDGAGELFEPREATIGLLKAVRICINMFEHNLARYYIEKALTKIRGIEKQRDRNQLLKEVHEAQYMIYAAQGNLVAASEVCKQLVEMTNDRKKKEKLQLYWAQLQLSLGRHNEAYQMARMILRTNMRPLVGWLENALGSVLFVFAGSRHSRSLSDFLGSIFSRWGLKKRKSEEVEQAHHCLSLMLLSQFHGCEAKMGESLCYAMRLRVHREKLSKWSCIFRVLNGALALRRGNVQTAYREVERIEKYLRAEGNQESLRWMVSLRSLWYDYPNGRIERLLHIFSEGSGVDYPTSGLLHFETYGLRAWLRLIAPSALPSRDGDPNLDRRRRRKGADEGNRQGVGSLSLPGDDGSLIPALKVDTLLESNNARRVLDSGENGQYTALALFADALRFGLCDKVESLKRAHEQMQRQRSFSALGDAFEMFGAALLALVSGRQSECLKFYKKACRRIMRSHSEVVSQPVSDGLRFALVFFPLWSHSLNRPKGWPRGESLAKLFERIDLKLRKMEGVARSKHNAVSLLFTALQKHSRGETRNALTDLDLSIREARMHKTELVECLSLSLLAVSSAERKIGRASEHTVSVVKLSRRFRWNLVERFIVAASRVHGVDVEELLPATTVKSSLTSRGRTTQVALNHLMKNLQNLLESRSLDQLLAETTRLATEALQVNTGYLFLKDNKTGSFECRVERVGKGEAAIGVSADVVKKWLPRHLDEYVKLVPLDSNSSYQSLMRGQTVSGQRTVVSDPGEQTVALVADSASEEATVAFEAGDSTSPDKEPRGASQSASSGRIFSRGSRFLTLISIANHGELYGWIALPDVSEHFHNAREMEQELMILGMHVGYLIDQFMSGDEWHAPATNRALSESRAALDGELPEHIRVEAYSSAEERHSSGWKAYGVKSEMIVACGWRFHSRSEKLSRRTSDILARHLQLFVYSLRQQYERPSVKLVSEKLVTDFTAIFESVGQNGRGLDAIDMSFVVYDLERRTCFEGVFGAELFSFSGESSVDHEVLHEMRGVISGQQSLIFRERMREVRGHCGWAFGLDRQSRISLYRFADVDFIDRYMSVIRRNENLLPESLGIQGRGRGIELFVIFSMDPEQNSVGQHYSTAALR